MDDDFRRIDSVAAAVLGDGYAHPGTPDGADTPRTYPSDPRAWVVFHGRTPGVHTFK
jgi:hypothetical protein